jgi:hypothetical protein
LRRKGLKAEGIYNYEEILYGKPKFLKINRIL